MENSLLLPLKNNKFAYTWTKPNCSQTEANKSHLVLGMEKYKNWAFIHLRKTNKQTNTPTPNPKHPVLVHFQ